MLHGRNRVPEKLAGQFIHFFGAGLVATLCQYTVLVGLTTGLGGNPVAASAAGFGLGALINYHLNRKYTFGSSIPLSIGLSRFYTVAGIGLAGNTTIMHLLVDRAGLHFMAAQVATTAMLLLWNFIGHRFWTFREAS